MVVRTRWVRLIVAATIGLGATLFVALQLVFLTQPHGVTGADIDVADGTVRMVQAGTPAAAAGLVSGDRLFLDRLSLRERLQLTGGDLPEARRMTVDVEHPDGTIVPTSIGVVAYTLTDPETAATVARTLAFAVSVAIGVVLATMLGSPAAWLFFAFALVSAPTYVSLMASTAFPDPVLRLAAIAAVLPIAGGFVLAAFLARVVEADDAPWSPMQRGLLFAAACGLVLAAVEGCFFERLPRPWLEVPRDLGYLAAFPALLIRLRTTAPERRDRLRWIAAASLTVFTAQTVSIAFAASGRIGGFDALASFRLGSALGASTVVFAGAVAYAMLAGHVADARRSLASGSSRLVLGGALLFALFGIVGIAFTVVDQPALDAPLLAIVAIAFGLAIRSFLVAMRRREHAGSSPKRPDA
jgi:hypothetical protein